MDEKMKPDDSDIVSEYAVVQSFYVRQRNCLLLQADFSPLFVGFYLHRMQHDLHPSASHAELFKELLAFFTLFLVSRPWNEHHAWTVNVKSPQSVNLFAAGSSLSEDAVGCILTRDVREVDTTLFYAQNSCPERDTHTSVIPVFGDLVATWVEEFFRRSEQRPARAFRGKGDIFYLVVAESNADFDWISELTLSEVVCASQVKGSKLLETRRFTFRCGCNIGKIISVLHALRKDFADVLSEQGYLDVACPRCGVKYTITADMLNR